MKKLSFYTILCCLAVVCTFSLNSCQEFNIDSQAEFPPLLETDAQSEYAVLAKSPNTIIFNISSNTPWKIESNKNWCVPTPAMSSASSLIAEVSVIMEENPDEQERTAILTITADRIKESKRSLSHKQRKEHCSYKDSMIRSRVKVVKLPLPSLPIKRGK